MISLKRKKMIPLDLEGDNIIEAEVEVVNHPNWSFVQLWSPKCSEIFARLSAFGGRAWNPYYFAVDLSQEIRQIWGQSDDNCVQIPSFDMNNLNSFTALKVRGKSELYRSVMDRPDPIYCSLGLGGESNPLDTDTREDDANKVYVHVIGPMAQVLDKVLKEGDVLCLWGAKKLKRRLICQGIKNYEINTTKYSNKTVTVLLFRPQKEVKVLEIRSELEKDLAEIKINRKLDMRWVDCLSDGHGMVLLLLPANLHLNPENNDDNIQNQIQPLASALELPGRFIPSPPKLKQTKDKETEEGEQSRRFQELESQVLNLESQRQSDGIEVEGQSNENSNRQGKGSSPLTLREKQAKETEEEKSKETQAKKDTEENSGRFQELSEELNLDNQTQRDEIEVEGQSNLVSTGQKGSSLVTLRQKQRKKTEIEQSGTLRELSEELNLDNQTQRDRIEVEGQSNQVSKKQKSASLLTVRQKTAKEIEEEKSKRLPAPPPLPGGFFLSPPKQAKEKETEEENSRRLRELESQVLNLESETQENVMEVEGQSNKRQLISSPLSLTSRKKQAKDKETEEEKSRRLQELESQVLSLESQRDLIEVQGQVSKRQKGSSPLTLRQKQAKETEEEKSRRFQELESQVLNLESENQENVMEVEGQSNQVDQVIKSQREQSVFLTSRERKESEKGRRFQELESQVLSLDSQTQRDEMEIKGQSKAPQELPPVSQNPPAIAKSLQVNELTSQVLSLESQSESQKAESRNLHTSSKSQRVSEVTETVGTVIQSEKSAGKQKGKSQQVSVTEAVGTAGTGNLQREASYGKQTSKAKSQQVSGTVVTAETGKQTSKAKSQQVSVTEAVGTAGTGNEKSYGKKKNKAKRNLTESLRAYANRKSFSEIYRKEVRGLDSEASSSAYNQFQENLPEVEIDDEDTGSEMSLDLGALISQELRLEPDVTIKSEPGTGTAALLGVKIHQFCDIRVQVDRVINLNCFVLEHFRAREGTESESDVGFILVSDGTLPNFIIDEPQSQDGLLKEYPSQFTLDDPISDQLTYPIKVRNFSSLVPHLTLISGEEKLVLYSVKLKLNKKGTHELFMDGAKTAHKIETRRRKELEKKRLEMETQLLSASTRVKVPSVIFESDFHEASSEPPLTISTGKRKSKGQSQPTPSANLNLEESDVKLFSFLEEENEDSESEASQVTSHLLVNVKASKEPSELLDKVSNEESQKVDKVKAKGGELFSTQESSSGAEILPPAVQSTSKGPSASQLVKASKSKGEAQKVKDKGRKIIRIRQESEDSLFSKVPPAKQSTSKGSRKKMSQRVKVEGVDEPSVLKNPFFIDQESSKGGKSDKDTPPLKSRLRNRVPQSASGIQSDQGSQGQRKAKGEVKGQRSTGKRCAEESDDEEMEMSQGEKKVKGEVKGQRSKTRKINAEESDEELEGVLEANDEEALKKKFNIRECGITLKRVEPIPIVSRGNGLGIKIKKEKEDIGVRFEERDTQTLAADIKVFCVKKEEPEYTWDSF